MPDKPTPDVAPMTAAAAVTVVVTDPTVRTKASAPAPPVVRKSPVCPHCGVVLRAEHDSDNHLHCDGPGCTSCCFDPGDPPTLRPNFPPCPSA